MNKYKFWEKLSKYSTVLVVVLVVVFMFFRSSIENYLRLFYYFGVVILAISVFSELMKYVIKKRRSDE